MSYQWPDPGPPPVPEGEGHQQQAPQDAERAPKAVAVAVTSIVLDLREKRRPLLGWLSIALATLGAVFLWVSIFAGT